MPFIDILLRFLSFNRLVLVQRGVTDYRPQVWAAAWPEFGEAQVWFLSDGQFFTFVDAFDGETWPDSLVAVSDAELDAVEAWGRSPCRPAPPGWRLQEVPGLIPEAAH